MNKEFICYMDAKDYRDMHKGTIKWCAVGTKPSENDTDVKLFALLPPAELTDEEIGDFEHQIIRACGLSTANSDINPIGIRQIIKEILRKASEK